MEKFNILDLKKLYVSSKDSHKGQNGKLLLIGGSRLFHAASLWSLQVASRIVDMVFYASVPENNAIVQSTKEEFRNGIVIPRSKIDSYIEEADCILIGPGLPRKEGQEEGEEDTKELTENLLKKYPNKKWVIDGGSLQVIDLSFIPSNAILTPHFKELEKLFSDVIPNSFRDPVHEGSEMLKQVQHDIVGKMAKKYSCVILLKGETDVVCSQEYCVRVSGGNAGMTKGGTGDVLSGLVAALNCKNDPFLAAAAGSFINKKAGESLYQKVGLYFNASDLADEIPKVMKELI